MAEDPSAIAAHRLRITHEPGRCRQGIDRAETECGTVKIAQPRVRQYPAAAEAFVEVPRARDRDWNREKAGQSDFRCRRDVIQLVAKFPDGPCCYVQHQTVKENNPRVQAFSD